MADDLDDELFAFAQGGSKGGKKRARKAASDSDEDASSGGRDGSDSDSDGGGRRPGRKQAKTGKGGRGRKASSDDDDDYEEAAAGIDEDLFENADDKRRLMEMNELDREMILAERAEKRDKERQRKQLLQQGKTAAEKVSLCIKYRC